MTEQDRFIRHHPGMFAEGYLIQGRRIRQKEEWEGLHLRIQDLAAIPDHFTLVNVSEEHSGSRTAGNGFSQMEWPLTNQPAALLPAQNGRSVLSMRLILRQRELQGKADRQKGGGGTGN